MANSLLEELIQCKKGKAVHSQLEDYFIMRATDRKCLIAYFSRRGKNYVSGKIVDLKVGNTEVVANMIPEKKCEATCFILNLSSHIPKTMRKLRK